jgi:hypothetical protein
MLFFFFFTITADRFIALGSTICGGATDGETGAKKTGSKSTSFVAKLLDI